ncbi:MAG: TIGR03032 family protein [Stagnimonas sp.]|nr:TIGR03032 family protein [Stagnimonas sp.]
MNDANSSDEKAADVGPLACSPDLGFSEWMSKCGGSLVISTYQAGKLLLVGWNGQQVTFLPRQFDKPMGLDVVGNRMALATRNNVTLFASDEVLANHYDHDTPGRYDALYLPRLSYHTANIAAHDLALTNDDLWVVNTRFSCLAGLSSHYSFEPRWRPPFVTECVPEDRCHLNGLAMVDGKPGYVTMLGETNTAGGWRANKVSGGLVMDVRSDEIVFRGLAMPHSPRWNNGALWVLNSGAGEILRWTPGTQRPEVICTLPAYLRGLTFFGPYALIGLCMIREKKVFGGMPVQERFPKLYCGIAIVDTRIDRPVGMLTFHSGCTEIYDVRFLPGIRKPNVLNLEKEQALQTMSAPPDVHYWLRPENAIHDPDDPIDGA